MVGAVSVSRSHWSLGQDGPLLSSVSLMHVAYLNRSRCLDFLKIHGFESASYQRLVVRPGSLVNGPNLKYHFVIKVVDWSPVYFPLARSKKRLIKATMIQTAIEASASQPKLEAIVYVQ